MEMMKLMDKHKNIINLLGVCTQDGEEAAGHALGAGDGAVGVSGRQGAGLGQGRG